jgi:hypothetical protein
MEFRLGSQRAPNWEEAIDAPELREIRVHQSQTKNITRPKSTIKLGLKTLKCL